jgi:hypothetical protein
MPTMPTMPTLPTPPIQHVAAGTVVAAQDEDSDPDETPGDAKSDHVQSGDVTVSAGESVGDVVAFHGNATLSAGAHAHSVTAMGGNVDIASGAVVDRDVAALGGTVHVRAGAKVGGQASSLGGKVFIEPGALVHGDQTSVPMPSVGSLKHAAKHAAKHSVESSSEGSVLLTIGWMLALFALYFSLGLILIVFFRPQVDTVADALRTTPAKSLAVGMLGVMAVPLLGVLLIVTGVGIPVALVGAGAVGVGEVLGFTALAMLLGRSLPRGGAGVAALAVGTGALVVLQHLPYLGLLIEVLSAVIVLGAVLTTRFGQQSALNSLPNLNPNPPEARAM